jgi:hypothetical protein
MPKLLIEAGSVTGELVDFITNELDDEEIDSIVVDRKLAEPSDLANEPITLAVTLTTVGVTTIVVIARLIERWMETRRQTTMMKIVAEGFEKSDSAGKALAKIAERHSAISVAYRLPEVPKTK